MGYFPPEGRKIERKEPIHATTTTATTANSRTPGIDS